MVDQRKPKSSRFGRKPDNYYRNAPGADRASREVRDAWFRAKAADPTLTQKRFEKEALGRENPDGRYLRLILEGKRSGRLIVREQTAVPGGGSSSLYQAVFTDRSGNVRSFNVVGAGASGGLAAPLVHDSLVRSGVPSAVIAKWAAKYDIDMGDIDPDSLTVRRVMHVNRPTERVRIR